MSDGPMMKGVAGSGLTLVSALGGKNAAEKAKFIPLRVSGEERVYLRLLEGALDVSEYTDNVDIVRGFSFRYEMASINRQASTLITSTLCGDSPSGTKWHP